MKCTLDGTKTRVFAKAVQSLAKFGSDLFVEADPDTLQLRVLNHTRSAVGTIRFSKNFFDGYEVDAGSEWFCKLSMKACLAVFRCTKQVERCDMKFLPNRTKFQVQLKCRLDTIKNTVISVDDEENITSNISPESTLNVICGHSRLFCEISNNFNSAEEEITLQVLRNAVTFKNYIEGSRVTDKFMRSQLKITADEFDTYNVGTETSVTFCLKEFRAFLMFAEALNEKISVKFDEAGSPVFIGVNRSDEIDCLLILSSLSPDEVSYCEEFCENELQDTVNTVNTRTVQKRKVSQIEVRDVPTKQIKAQKRIEDDTTLSNSSSVFNFNSALSVAEARNVEKKSNKSSGGRLMLLTTSDDTESGNVGIVPPQPLDKSVASCNTQLSKMDDAQEDMECILSSPSRLEVPYVRSIFSRCFESTYIPQEPSSSNQIYAPASDTEE